MNLDLGRREVLGVPGRDRESVLHGGGGEQGVDHPKPPVGIQITPPLRDAERHRKQAFPVGLFDSVDPLQQGLRHGLVAACRQLERALAQLGDGQHRNVQIFVPLGG
ncbi:hypothetical protein GCM10007979_20060 [Nocardioides albus]|uniref:Uncharacterized protein n=1 Tax=Nocardioides albus TaxID=1841 RepID=A0A7W5F7A5_9ACTN|nr:hypothetical protein [Nocardioides albus]GGU21452.1 hypothetical protein GCM10007979_20060 [Nocardioides albus]